MVSKYVNTLFLLVSIISLIYLRLPSTYAFNVGIRGTTCSLDPSESNPCQSLYDAICDGAHCKCGPGTHEDKALKKCVPGEGSRRGGAGDDFGLPLDYVPGATPQPKPKTPKTPQQPVPKPQEPVYPQVPPGQPQRPVEGGYNPGASYPKQPSRGYPGHPNQPGYPNQPGIYPNQPGVSPNQPGYGPHRPGYDPNQPGYQPNQPGYNPNQPAYNPNQPGYNPNQPGYNPNQPGYNPNQPGYNPNQPGYNPNQPGYNPNQPGYNPNQPNYYPKQPGYNPNQPGGYNPNQPGRKSGTRGYPGDPHVAEKTGGGIGGGVGLLLLGGLFYFCCCRGEKGRNLRSKIPFLKGRQPAATYQMQQPGQQPGAPPPEGMVAYPQQPYYPQPGPPQPTAPAY